MILKRDIENQAQDEVMRFKMICLLMINLQSEMLLFKSMMILGLHCLINSRRGQLQLKKLKKAQVEELDQIVNQLNDNLV